MGRPLEQGRVEGDERGREGISVQAVLHPLCATQFVLQQLQGCDQREKKHKTTQPSSEGVRESSAFKDDAEMVKCCQDRNNRVLCSHQQPELGMKTRERFGREGESKKILYQP